MATQPQMYYRYRLGAIAFLCAFTTTLLTGCGPTERRVPLQGEITLDGQPLVSATLILTPKGEGQVVAASIIEGKFKLPRQFGPRPGDYLVRINPIDGNDDPQTFVTNAKAAKKKQLIPKEYQCDGKLSVTISGKPDENLLLELNSH